jgi:hypothetical protein
MRYNLVLLFVCFFFTNALNGVFTHTLNEIGGDGYDNVQTTVYSFIPQHLSPSSSS